ncbi:MAG: tetratricopeptide repeat protein [Planctomycetes bacterium]|nr:tetratricopeptide repeat protein [Planctomycetota bacterium]
MAHRPDDSDETAHSTASVPPRALPSRIGNYRIVRELGRGGMGVVYEAEQESPRRTVALKVVTAGVMSREALARFDLEAQVLGRLQHPGIAHIFEAGKFESGGELHPYFAMELIRGEPLIQYAENRGLGPRDRLELIAKICDAIHHAHQRGVVHRDLKPGNILVDEHGQPKVLDFGVARATDSDIRTTTLRTDIGQLIGTVPYMSPEQASGDPDRIDTRSDVYSLGVVAYQLLSGRMPYEIDRMMVHEAVRIVLEEDPLPLSTIVRTLRGDVETIIGKALEKEVDRRYASADAFATDIRHFLADQPIAARAPSAFYRLRKFARRNKATVASLALILLALTAGLIGTTKGYVAARRNADEAGRNATVAKRNADEAQRNAEEAKRNEKQARDETARANQIAKFLQEILAGVDPAIAQGKDTSLLKQILDTTIARVGAELKDQPLAEAALRDTIATSYFGIADFTSALEQYRIAAEVRVRATGSEDAESIAERRSAASLLNNLGRPAEGLKALESVLDLARRVLGDDAVETDRTRCELGIVHLGDGRPDTAAPLFERSLEFRRRTLGDDDEMTLIAENCLGLARVYQKRFDEGEKLLADALERRRRVNGPTHPETIKAEHNLAGAYDTVARYDDAERLYRQSLAGDLEVLGAEHPTTLGCRHNVSALLRKRGRLDAAAAVEREVVEALRRVQGPDHPQTLQAETGLGILYRQMRQPDKALEIHQRVYEVDVRNFGPDHPDSLVAQANVASDFWKAGRKEEAERINVSLAERMPRVLGEHHTNTLTLFNDLGLLYMDLERYDDAEKSIRRALDGRRETLGPDHPDTLASVYTLGTLMLKKKQFAEAIPPLGTMLAGWSRLFGDENQYSVASAGRLLESAESADRLVDAEPHLRTLVAYHRRRAKIDHDALGRSLAVLGRALVEREQFADAEPILLESYEAIGESDAARGKPIAADLARLYEKRGDATKAEEWRARAGK